MASRAAGYAVRRTVQGSLELCGRSFDRGQVIDRETIARLEAVATDIDNRLQQMTRQGFFEELPRGFGTYECGACGARFTYERHRDNHGDRRHPRAPVPADPLEVAGGRPMIGKDGELRDVTGVLDATGDRVEREEEREAPIDFTKTAASLKH